NRNCVSRLGTEDLAGRRDQLRQHQRRGGGCGGLEVVTRGGEGALQGAGEGEACEPRVERLEATPVILPRHGLRRQQRLGRAYHEPQREQALAFGPTYRVGDQPHQAPLGGNPPAGLTVGFPPPPSATSCCASPRSSGPPTTTGRYPAVPSRSARALQCATGQRLVAWAAPGASAASRAPPPSPRSASHR